VIVWPNDEAASARALAEKLRASEAAFHVAARAQPSLTLAATGGRVAPMPAANGVPGLSETVNSVAGPLKPGQVSDLVEDRE
jgi:hypothetical protein